MTPVPRAALALVLAAYVLPLAVPVPLMEDDEGLHAAIAVEMVEGGDWVVPRLMGEPFLDKPILYFWMQAASISAFGRSEFAVRLPGTVMALAGVAATGWLAWQLAGPLAAWWAALCYATMLLPYAVSLAPLHDLVMVPLAALAIGAFWRVHHARSPAAAAGWTAMAGVVLGLSMLGKGLTGAGLVGVGMAAWMAWTRTWTRRLVASATVALGLAAVIAWPWYAAMETASPGYLRYFILERHIGGVAGEDQRHAGRPFWYYAPILVAGAWPWLFDACRRSPARAGLAERLLWAWLVADLVLLSASGSKLATYLLPAFPALAILAGRAIAEGGESKGVARLRFWVALVTASLPLAAEAYLALTSGWGRAGLVGLVGATAPLALLGWTMESARRESWAGASRLVTVTAATLVVIALTIRPVVAAQFTAVGLSAHFNRDDALPTRLYIIDEGVGSFLFYLKPELRRGLTPDRVRRLSRFSLADVAGDAEGFAAIAWDRLDGVRELYDLPVPGSGTPGAFAVVALADVHPRQR
ncbi:MAG: glycosyltransferase family 39 protein [Vicinamibacterales bacterium]